MTLDSLIRAADPVASDAVPGPDSFEAHAILRRITAEGPARRRARLAFGGAAVGAAALTAGIAVALVAGDAVPGVTPSAAAATLGHLAAVAVDQPAADAPGPGQFEYTRSQEAYADCSEGAPSYCYLLPEERQIWIGPDGSGRILETYGSPSFETTSDRAAWERAGRPAISSAPSDTTFGPGTLSVGPPGLAALPTDPSALAAALSARRIEGGPPGPAEDFVQIGDLLRETDASPALRATIYKVAAGIPGVKVLGTVTDPAGRSGIGVGRVGADGVEQEYVFDPATSALLAEEQVATRADAGGTAAPAGTVLGWAAYLSQGIVGSLAETPTGTAPAAPPVTCTTVAAPASSGEPRPAPGVGTAPDTGAAATRCVS